MKYALSMFLFRLFAAVGKWESTALCATKNGRVLMVVLSQNKVAIVGGEPRLIAAEMLPEEALRTGQQMIKMADQASGYLRAEP